MKLNYRLVILIFAGLLLSGCFGDSKEITSAKNLVKSSLLDGESAQFSDVEFYKKTNYVCGLVNAKNKMGGYVGKKKFIVAINDSKSYIDPDREIPEAPRSPSYVSMQATMDYAMQSAAWMSKVQSIRSQGDAFDFLTKHGCTNNPPEVSKDSSINKIKENISFEYSDEVATVPPGFLGDDLSSIGDKVKVITASKDQIETTDEYNKRMSVLKFDPVPLSFDKNYSIKMINSTFGLTRSIEYNADKEVVTINYNKICKDDVIYKYKKEKPIICEPSSEINLSISNKNKYFGKVIVNRKEYDYIDNPDYDFVDSFKLSRDKVPLLYKSDTDKSIQIATLLVGKIVEEQKNPVFSWVEHPYIDKTATTRHAVSGKVIPFEITAIVHYNEKSGEILSKKEIQPR
jgi:hypothetical protein